MQFLILVTQLQLDSEWDMQVRIRHVNMKQRRTEIKDRDHTGNTKQDTKNTTNSTKDTKGVKGRHGWPLRQSLITAPCCSEP